MENKNKKAFYFTLDALFSLIILITVITVIPYTGINFTEPKYKTSYLQEDAMNLLSAVKTSEVNNQWINQVLQNSTYNESFFSGDTLIETVSKLWATNYSDDAKNITGEFLNPSIENKDNFGIFFNTPEGPDPVFIRNQTPLDLESSSTEEIVSIRSYISGVEKGQNLTGYTARAFLQKKESTRIVYFGGYTGDGNVTAIIDLPNLTNVTNVKFEIAINAPSKLYINNNFIRNIDQYSTDNLRPINFSLTQEEIDDSFQGGPNTIEFTNSTFDADTNTSVLLSISGGYIQIDYRTESPGYASITRQYIPGISGVINEYDSIYAPSTIRYMDAFLHYGVNLSQYNNATFYLRIGNVTVYRNLTNQSIQDIQINLTDSQLKSNFSGSYDPISNQTIPIRVGFEEFSGSTGEGIADVAIITDTSGSMDWSVGEDANSQYDFGATQCGNLSDPNNKIFWGNNSRMSLARCLDIGFVTTILKISGNRVGLVAYNSNPIGSYLNLTSNLTAVINGSSGISKYTANGGTAICAGIRKAKQMLRDQGSYDRRKFILVMTDGLANYQCNDTNIESLGVCNPDDCTSSNNHCVSVGDGYGCLYNVIPVYSSSERRGEIFNLSVIPFNNPDALVVGDSNAKRGYNFSNGRWVNISSYTTGFNSLGYTATIFNMTGDGKFDLITSNFSNINPQGYFWNGTGWTSNNSLVSGLPNRTVAGDIIYNFSKNNKFTLFAGNSTGYILGYAWNGTSWVLNNSLANGIGDQGTNTFPAVAFNVTGDGNWTMIIGRTSSASLVGLYWNGTSWKTNAAYVNGLSADTSYAYTPSITYNLTSNRYHLLLGVRDGTTYFFAWDSGKWYKTCGDSVSDHAADQAITEASRVAALSNYNKTYAIGFGPIEYCPFAQEEMKDIAETGNGDYLVSRNSSQLSVVMQKWAADIASLSYAEQTANLTGNFSSIMYPDSYIEYDYDPVIINLPTGGEGLPQLGIGGDLEENLKRYGNILTLDSSLFNNSRTMFNYTEGTILEAVATSYSGPKWTKYVLINNSNTSGFTSVYNVTSFGSNLLILGDAFRVNIPINKIKNTNEVELKIANSSDPSFDVNASDYDKVIYTILVLSNYSYSNITSAAAGCNWIVEYYDGTSETISVPKDYSGSNTCYYGSSFGQQQFACSNSTAIIQNDAIAQATYIVLRNYIDKNPEDCKLDVKISDYFIKTMLLPSVPFLQYTSAEILTWR